MTTNLRLTRTFNVQKIIKERFKGKRALFRDAVGMSTSHISTLLAPSGYETISFGEKLARRIEEKLDLPKYYLDTPVDFDINTSQDYNLLPLVTEGTVPKGRYVVIEGEAEEADGDRIFLKRVEASASEVKIFTYTVEENVYALKVTTDTLRPRVKAGEYLVMSREGEPAPGDDVLIETNEGELFIKEFFWERDGSISCGSVNDLGRPNAIRRSDVKYMHRILNIVQRSSVQLR